MGPTRYIFCLFSLCLLLAFPVYASDHWLKHDHPDVYVVQKGDTLWDIAGRFLHDPWRWPEVWQASGLENPHLIYPGDSIVLSGEGDAVKLQLVRGNTTEQTVYQDGRKTVKLSPRVRSMPAQAAIPTIPLNVIGPFLTQSKITRVGALNRAPTISAVDEERILVSEGNRFYAAGLNVEAGEALSIYRPGKILVHPETGEELGQEAHFLGHAKVEVAAKMSTLILQRGVEEIRPGDSLLPVEEDRVEPYYFPKLPKGHAKGFILTVLGGINQVGQNQVVTLSGGRDMEREEGDVLAVLQTKQDFPSRVKGREDFEKQVHAEEFEQFEFMPVEVGQLIVFKVYEKTSLALVMDAVRSIHLRDEVRRP